MCLLQQNIAIFSGKVSQWGLSVNLVNFHSLLKLVSKLWLGRQFPYVLWAKLLLLVLCPWFCSFCTLFKGGSTALLWPLDKVECPCGESVVPRGGTDASRMGWLAPQWERIYMF